MQKRRKEEKKFETLLSLSLSNCLVVGMVKFNIISDLYFSIRFSWPRGFVNMFLIQWFNVILVNVIICNVLLGTPLGLITLMDSSAQGCTFFQGYLEFRHYFGKSSENILMNSRLILSSAIFFRNFSSWFDYADGTVRIRDVNSIMIQTLPCW